MALSVAQWGIDSNIFNTTSPSTVTGLSWSSGDIIVVIGGSEDAATTLNNPTNANLTFGAASSSQTGSGGSECSFYVWQTTAGSSQASQTISCTRGGSVGNFCIMVWVITGSPTGTANATSNRTESTFSLTVSAGSVVCYGFFDFNAAAAGRTLATGSGSGTERTDQSDTTSYNVYGGEWVGVSAGTTSFGVTSYTSLKVSHGAIEVLAPSAAVTVKTLAALGVG